MRRILVALATAALLLSACSSDGDPDAGANETDSNPTDPSAVETVPEIVTGTPGEDLPAVEGGFGDAPILTFTGADAPDDVTIAVVIEGDGAEVQTGDTLVSHYQVGLWDSDAVAQSTFDMGTPALFGLDQLIPGWKYGLVGTHVGDRVVLAIPSEFGYPQGNDALGAAPGDVLVFVVDVIDARPGEDFIGEAGDVSGDTPEGISFSAEPGSPAVPVIENSAEEPTEVTSIVISEGTGAPVEEGDFLIAGYGATTWSGEPFGSSWSSVTWSGQADPYGVQPAIGVTLGAGSVFDESIGVPLGSRVLFLFPGDPEQGVEAQAIIADLAAAF